MRCVLPAVNVKLFAKSTHCLAKLGSEIYIEALESGLALKTVNSSRSAFACFLFLRPLFKVYEKEVEELDDDGEEAEDFKCKVAVKTMLQVFKSLSSIERSVESCDMSLDGEECRLVFQLKCRHGITKTHQLTFQECETLQAVFAKDLSPNLLKCEHKLLNDIVANFSPSLEEMTLVVSPCRVILRSYVDAEDASTSLMKTEMMLNPEEFLDFQVGVDTDVTFSLKDLRAILAFCDITNAPVHMHFEVGGKPLIISIEQEDGFKANFVLATISEDEFTSQTKNGTSVGSFTKNTSSNRTTHNNGSSRYGAQKTAVETEKIRSKPVSTSRLRQSSGDAVVKSFPEESDIGLNKRPVTSNDKELSVEAVQASPEIPLQNFIRTVADEATEKQRAEPPFQKIKKVFFEATQSEDDHTLVVLAPDSGEEGG